MEVVRQEREERETQREKAPVRAPEGHFSLPQWMFIGLQQDAIHYFCAQSQSELSEIFPNAKAIKETESSRLGRDEMRF